MEFRTRIYQSYGEFKDWDMTNEGQSQSQKIDNTYFDLYEGELSTHDIKAPGSLLEIGFGSAHFLSWAKTQGFQVVGVEVNSQFVEQAKKIGLEAYHLPLQQIKDLKTSYQNFDYVVLFDILEHLYPEEIIELFDALYTLIKPGGKVLCRFPNGLSPFSTQTQYADMTHVTVLTPEKMRQVGLACKFELIKFGNTYRSLKIGKKSKLVKIILYKLRDIFEICLGLFYFGGKVPLDPNLTLSLRKR